MSSPYDYDDPEEPAADDDDGELITDDAMIAGQKAAEADYQAHRRPIDAYLERLRAAGVTNVRVVKATGGVEIAGGTRKPE
jgi:hypothetical protein